MPSKTENRGICSTCIYAKSCALRHGCNQAIFHCEEFECNEANPRAHAPPMNVSSPVLAVAANPGHEVKHLGLCVNCEHRDTCTFTKPEGGVWRCNEYC
jgi:hypothetical protein